MNSSSNRVPTHMTIPDNIDVEHYICACCDLVGQNSSLVRWPFTTEDLTPEAEDNILKSLRDVYRFRASLENVVKGIVEQGDEPTSYPETATDEQKSLADKLRQPVIHTQAFGDTVLIYAPAKANNVFQVKAAIGLIISVGLMFRYSLTSGIPMRGGIDLGPGCELFPGEIYGPVLATSHHIESKIADYPRLVVGAGLINFIEMLRNYTNAQNNSMERVYRGIGHQMHQYLIADVDGHIVVDFASKKFDEFLSLFPKDKMKDMPPITDLMRFALNEAKRFHHDDKLRAKYNRLKCYIQRSRPDCSNV